MLTKRILVILLAISILNTFAYPQNVKNADSKQLEEKAVGLLKETIGEISTLKSPVNRFYFTAEAARILWPYDEPQSRRMADGLMLQMRGSINELVAEIKKPGAIVQDEGNIYDEVISNVMSKEGETQPPKDKLKPELSGKLSGIARMRTTLITVVAERDPLLAYRFYKETDEMLSGPMKYYNRNSIFFPFMREQEGMEVKIAEGLINLKEKDKALELTRYLISKRNNGVIKVLKKIYANYPEETGRLGALVFDSLTKPGAEKADLKDLKAVFDLALRIKRENPGNQLMNESQIRAVARLIGNAVLAKKTSDYLNPSALAYAKRIEKYAPAEAAQIRRKFASKKGKRANTSYEEYEEDDYYETKYGGNAVNTVANVPANAPASNTMSNAVVIASNTKVSNTAANAANTAANTAAEAANRAANTAVNAAIEVPSTSVKTRRARGRSNPPAIPTPKPKSKFELASEMRFELMDKLKVESHTAAERKEIVAQCRKYAISQNWLSPFQDKGGVMVVGTLVDLSTESEDKQLADDLMNEAASFANPKLVNFSDYGARLFLAMGHSERNPEKAFELLESMTSINEVISGAIKVGEFIDITTMFITEGEANLGMLPFQTIANAIMPRNSSDIFSNVLRNLAKADFERTKALANRFERKEVQITAKMLIVLSLLGKSVEAEKDGDPIGAEFFQANPSLSRSATGRRQLRALHR